MPHDAKSVFLLALAADAAGRAAVLDAACGGDAALRRRVDALLAAHEAPAAAWEREPADAGAVTAEFPADPPADEVADVRPLLAPSGRPGALGRLGHYDITAVLGRGGFGVVFKAFDSRLERPVAIKVLAPALAATSPARQRFLREARSAAAVRHEHVVATHAVEDVPLPYIVMEFIGGRTLQQAIDQDGPLPAATVARLGEQIAWGLAAAHAQGIVHRDIKPANILLEAGPVPRVKLTDFGLARAADDASLTQSGFLAGTPLYMAPEQARGEAVDARSDLFSLGSVLYAMLAGRPPFRAPTTVAVLKRVCDDTPRPIGELAPEAPAWLTQVIARLHAKDPAGRPQTAAAVAESLATGVAPAAPAPARTSRRLAAAAAVAAVVFAGLVVTRFGGTALRLLSPEGTLVVEVDDPAVSVRVDGEEAVVAGAGGRELRLRAGRHEVEASKGGQPFRREVVTVTRDGRQVLRVGQEPPAAAPAAPAVALPESAAAAWGRRVAAMAPAQQVRAVAAKLKELNPAFDGKLKPVVEGGAVVGLTLCADGVDDLGPVAALRGLRELYCNATDPGKSELADLSPLAGLPLTHLSLHFAAVNDLTPLRGMPLTGLDLRHTPVADLRPLAGMPLHALTIQSSQVRDLGPLAGMKLKYLDCMNVPVTDLTPLKGMPLEELLCAYAPVSDLSPLAGMPLRSLNVSNTKVTDLKPLKGSRLDKLVCNDTGVTDLGPLSDSRLVVLTCVGSPVTDFAPLRGLPLRQAHCNFRKDRDGELLRSLTTLEMIDGVTPAEFFAGPSPP